MNIAIIDDEKNIRDLYSHLIKSNFPECKNIYEASSTATAIELLQGIKADIVILDIDLKDGSGFDVLQAVKPHNFALIFATAFNEYAIKAIKFSALDYILKPVDEAEFCNALKKALNQSEKTNIEKQLKNYFEHYVQTAPQKIVLKTARELIVVDITDIVYCRSDNSYTTFFLQNGEEIIVSRGMGTYEDMLSAYNFFRTHTSYLVNLTQVKKLDKTDGGLLILKNGTEIPVSFRKKAKLIHALENL